MEKPPSPVISVTADEAAAGVPSPVPGAPPKTVRFQCGLLRETETFSEEDLQDVTLDALLEYVVDMLNLKVRSRWMYTYIRVPRASVIMYVLHKPCHISEARVRPHNSNMGNTQWL